jgi:hypothetical protein
MIIFGRNLSQNKLQFFSISFAILMFDFGLSQVVERLAFGLLLLVFIFFKQLTKLFLLLEVLLQEGQRGPYILLIFLEELLHISYLGNQLLLIFLSRIGHELEHDGIDDPIIGFAALLERSREGLGLGKSLPDILGELAELMGDRLLLPQLLLNGDFFPLFDSQFGLRGLLWRHLQSFIGDAVM